MCTHTHRHTQKLPKVALHQKFTIERDLEGSPPHTHTETSQGILSQKEYYREDSGRLCACMHTHQKLPRVALHKKSTIERVLEVEGREEQS